MRNQRWSCVYRNQRVCQLRNIAFVIETSQVLLRSHSACPSTWHSTRRKTPKCTTPTNCTDFYKQATKIPPRPTSSKTSRGHPRKYPRQETLPDFRQVKITPRVAQPKESCFRPTQHIFLPKQGQVSSPQEIPPGGEP